VRAEQRGVVQTLEVDIRKKRKRKSEKEKKKTEKTKGGSARQEHPGTSLCTDS
jgi:hypothetical protein